MPATRSYPLIWFSSATVFIRWLTLKTRAFDTSGAQGDLRLKKASVRMRILAWVVILLGFTGLAWASSQNSRVDTNPMNYDPEVREAFHYFYNLDFPEAVGRFE